MIAGCKEEAILTIRMNCGSNFYILFNDKTFFRKVLTVLENIIVNGNVPGSVKIDIKDSNIVNSRIFENAQL